MLWFEIDDFKKKLLMDPSVTEAPSKDGSQVAT